MSEFLVSILLLACLGGLAAVAFTTLKTWRTIHWLTVANLPHMLRDELLKIRQEEEARLYLARRLDLDAAVLPPLGGWAASADSLILLAETILEHRPQVVVEFGSGVSTLVAGRALQRNGTGHLISYEHDRKYGEVTAARARVLGIPAELRVVPLEDAARYGYPGQWYVCLDLPDRIDLLLIDGPPAPIHPETRGAVGPAVFARLAPGGIIMLDDAKRPGERAIVERWRREFPDIGFDLLATDHGTAVGLKRS